MSIQLPTCWGPACQHLEVRVHEGGGDLLKSWESLRNSGGISMEIPYEKMCKMGHIIEPTEGIFRQTTVDSSRILEGKDHYLPNNTRKKCGWLYANKKICVDFKQGYQDIPRILSANPCSFFRLCFQLDLAHSLGQSPKEGQENRCPSLDP